MLNDIQYKILAYLQPVMSASPKELFDLFEPARYRTVKAELARLSEIAFVRFTGSSYCITSQGLSAFLSESECFPPFKYFLQMYSLFAAFSS